MSGVLDGDPDDRDMRAAEYVLGVLDGSERAAVDRALLSEPELAAALEEWEALLAPIATAVAPASPPPGLLERILADLPGGVVVRPPSMARRVWRSTSFWRATTAAAMAVAAGFAALAYLEPAAPRLTAVLTAAGSSGAVFLAQVQSDGSILIRPTGQVAVAPAKDLELWALAKGATVPVSLGVLPEGGRHVVARAYDRPATRLLISMEPKGGSPTGAPTGPVVYAGQLAPFH